MPYWTDFMFMHMYIQLYAIITTWTAGIQSIIIFFIYYEKNYFYECAWKTQNNVYLAMITFLILISGYAKKEEKCWFNSEFAKPI